MTFLCQTILIPFSVESFTTSLLQTYMTVLCGTSDCMTILVYILYMYLQLWIVPSRFLIPMEFEISNGT